MRHRHALHVALATVGAVVGLCCSPAAPIPPPPPTTPPEPAAVTQIVAPAPKPSSAAPHAASTAATSGPDCPSDCKGATSPALASALRARATAANACYQRALSAAGAKGSATVHLTVAPSGVACRADIELPEELASMRSCIKELFAGSTFPPPGSACAQVNLPLNFGVTDRDGGADAAPKR